MTTVQLDWSSAEVSDGELTVNFNEKTPKSWREAFLKATALLSHGTWTLRELKQNRVRIAPVEPGNEERVRHFLESAVLEANTTLVEAEDELFEPAAVDESEPETAEEAQRSEDRELTDRFRAFAA